MYNVPKVNITAAFGVFSGSWNKLLSAWISAVSISSVSVLFSSHDSALFKRPGMAIRSCSSRRTRDSTRSEKSRDRAGMTRT